MNRYNSFYDCYELPENTRFLTEKERMKVYYDLRREQYVCHVVRHQQHKRLPEKLIDTLFKDARNTYDESNPRPIFAKKEYYDARLDGIKNILRKSIEANKKFDKDFSKMLEDDVLNDYLKNKRYAELHAEHAAKKRFERKAGTNRREWDYFWTQTFDPALFEDPEKGLETFFTYIKNNAFRYGLKIIGAVEYGDEGGRLHFHCLVHVPEGFFPEGDLRKVSRYSIRDKKWKTVLESKTLREKFGINEFDCLHGKSAEELVRVIHYISDYTCKQDGRRYYSRGLPDCCYQYVNAEELLFCFDDGELKYVPRSSFVFGEDSFIAMLRSGKNGEIEPHAPLPFRDVG